MTSNTLRYLHSHTPSSFIKLQELPLISCHASVLFFSLSPSSLLIHDNINFCHVSIYPIIHTLHQQACQSINIYPNNRYTPKYPLIVCTSYTKFFHYKSKNFITFFRCQISPRERERKNTTINNIIQFLCVSKTNMLINNETLKTFT